MANVATILPGPIQRRIPECDRWALDPEVRIPKLEGEIARRHSLSRLLLRPEKALERAEFERKCSFKNGVEGFKYFMTNCIWTKDPERRVTGAIDLPLLPWAYMFEEIDFQEGVVGGNWAKLWIEGLNREPGKEVRLLHEKGRRLLMSIFACGFYVWAMRFYPGFDAWMSSDRDKAIDSGKSWNALFGKIRYMWGKVHEFYPWLLPALPEVGKGSYNKELYIQFPEWRIEGKEVHKELWENKIEGCTPNAVGLRGAAATMGFIDEAGWIDTLDEFLDSIEEMTPFLVLGSTPPESAEHPYAKRAMGEFSYTVTTTHWTMNPVMTNGIYWDEHGETRGPYTEKWRAPYYVQALKNRPSHVVARNLDLDYRSTAGSRIFLSFEATTVGSIDPQEKDFDVYDPTWPLEIWVDVGRRDPWACWWVQISDLTGEVRIVDFWMRSGVTAEWWVPLWLGWSPRAKSSWRTFPEYFPWKKRVPWTYGKEDLKLAESWNQRFGGRPDVGSATSVGTRRPRRIVFDMQARHRTPGAMRTVEQIVQQYGVSVNCETLTHNMESAIEHSNSILPRTTIAGRIATRKPNSGGIRYPSPVDIFLYWKWRESTSSSENHKPEHDIYSHGATAFLYGCKRLPATVEDVGRGPMAGMGVDRRKRRCYNVREVSNHGTTGIPTTNWTT